MTDDLRNRLDHLARRADEIARPDALDRLDRARHRRNRSRKVGALIVAMLIAIGGAATALITFDGDDASRVAGDPSATADPWTPPDVLTVWPENPVRGPSPEQVQAAMDAGDESMAWRSDARTVAERFGRVVLGWNDVESIVVLGQRIVLNGPTTEAWQIAPRCSDEGGDADCDSRPLHLSLVQPVLQGDGGIWGVASASSTDLKIRFAGADADGGRITHLDADSRMRWNIRVSEDVRAHVGYVFTNGCTETRDSELALHNTSVELGIGVRWGGDGCASEGAGYVFAYAQGASTVPVGDPFLEAAAFEYPWLSVLPVSVGLSRTDAASRGSDILRITCPREGLGTAIDQQVVASGPNGVAIMTPGEDAVQLVFDVRVGRGRFFLQGPPAFVDLPPGRHSVSCVHEGDIIASEETFTVLDRVVP
jgi:hypothetical protein